MPTLPLADHPIWKLAHGIVATVGLWIVYTHEIQGTHLPGGDASDVVGLIGGASLIRLIWSIYK